MEFKQYRRTQIAEMRPVTDEEVEKRIIIGCPMGISILDIDHANGSPKKGDMVARNPKNHNECWIVAEQDFKNNFEPMEKTPEPQKHVRFCPRDCDQLNITEKEQDEKGTVEHPGHVCKKFERRLYHGHYHPDLIRLDECYYDAHWENNYELKR